MYHVFLMYEKLEDSDKICGYLQLSGCKVLRGEVDKAADYEEMIQESDLVLLHHRHAGSCIEVCGYIRMITQIPIVVLSEDADEWGKIRLFQSGIDDYIVEPFSQGELIARMQSHVNRYKRLTRPFGYIENKHLVIEASERRVLVRGVEIFMTAKEFDILYYLAERPNQVVNKDEIYTEIWQDDMGKGYYNAVAAYIKRLRQKIEIDPYNPQYIETVWGIGYRFRRYDEELE